MRRPVDWVLLCSLAVLAEGCRRAASEDAAPSVGTDAAAIERVTRVCHLFQGGPAERRAACCASRPSGHLESACIRELGQALAAGRIELDDAKIQSCAEASDRALRGCDWVTPGQPVPPAECEGLTRGRVRAGGVCKSSLECEAPLHCEGSTPTQVGRCAEPKAAGASCGAPADALGTYLFARDLGRDHPSCAGECSLVTHRCESITAEPQAASQRAQVATGVARLPGEPCATDFDCRIGGCSGTPATCGMKCAVSFADTARFPSQRPLALPRRSPLEK